MKNHVLLGFKEVDITPTYNVQTIGFNRKDNESKGILHRLFAQISIWISEGEKCCLLAIDHIGFSVYNSNILRDEIADQLGIKREKVMLCFSHTHSGPNTSVEQDYFNFLRKRVLSGVSEAMHKLSPVKAVWGTTEANIGINRRNEFGVLDRRVNVLKVVDARTENLRLLILRVTAHANVLTRENRLISSDFIGVTRRLLQEKYSCNVMITQGASGDVKPRYVETLEALDKMAYEIISAIAPCIEKLEPSRVENIKMFSQTETFFADVPTLNRAEEIVREAMAENNIDGTNWLKEVESLNNKNIIQQCKDIEIQYFIVDNGCYCGTPSEIMCELAIEVTKECMDQLIYFGGYTNGCDGYLPTADEYDRGGYEVLHSYLIYYIYHRTVMPLNRETAKKLTRLITEKWLTIKQGHEFTV